jgi:hypothetical protein
MATKEERLLLEVALLFIELALDKDQVSFGTTEQLLAAAHSYVQGVIDPEFPLSPEAMEMFGRVMAFARPQRGVSWN